ncbi:mpv17-like protein 2 [Gigantopelta aegis]|uniref:mpv17-like protein 2 n=1 Tax=Gigantopelta aegis TaxID=1735272 RepID=UPI001B889A23|nr:mpv17-like protein 2 [Gigantopelta aegis]XP_041375457.1 mpv17-like protein 2 [Gigantopelta aegis]XP_041375458.1 mpv17-like protein 2 [Gigantopelta aegis]
MAKALLIKVARPIPRVVSACGRQLFSKRNLLYTNIGISVSLSISGDVLQQQYQINKKTLDSWNKERTTHVAITGFLIGPLVHYWYLYLDKWFPGRTASILAKKLLLDQLVCSPIYIVIFLVTLNLLEGATWMKIKSDAVYKGGVLYTAEWVVWPPAQLINFYFLPTRFRVLYDSMVSLCFDVYWSYVRYHTQNPDEVCSTEHIEQPGEESHVHSRYALKWTVADS